MSESTTNEVRDDEIGLVDTLNKPVDTAWSPEVVLDLPARFFATPRHAPRFRRPTDVMLLMFSVTVLLVTVYNIDDVDPGLLGSLVGVIENLPTVLLPLWQLSHDLLLLWALVLVVLAVVRRHGALTRDFGVAIGFTVGGAALAGRLAQGEWPALWESLVEESRPVDFPALGLAIAVALVSVASPNVTRPFRYAGRWIVVLGAVSFTVLGVTGPGQAFGALALGWGAAAGAHVLFGSPGGLPSIERVRVGLAGMGVDAEPIDIELRGGVVWVRARRPDGTELDVKVYGRDAWDAQLLVSIWRFLWYRDAGPTLSLSRLQQVEHEAFLTLLAERREVPVAAAVAAGMDVGGDAMLVTQRFGNGLDEVGDGVTDGQLVMAWRAIDRLHAAGISHGGLEPSRVRVDVVDIRLSDFGGAVVAPSTSSRRVDQAQLLVTMAVVVGPERAVRVAADTIGNDELSRVASFVQPAALTPTLRRLVDSADLDVDDIRKIVIGVTDQPARDLQRLRRLSLGRLLLTVMLLVASWALISSLADIGIDTIVDALQSASLPLVILAFFIGLTPRVANAVALTGAAPMHIPLGRLSALQFAITFVNLAMPSTAARAAVNIRFFQRSGMEPGTAVAVGVLDSVMGFVAQILLILTIVGFSLGSLDLQIGGHLSEESLQALLGVLLLALVVVVVVLSAVSTLRKRVVGALRHVWMLIGPVLSSPRRFATLLGGNLTAELLFSLCMYTVLRAFDQNVGYADVVLVNVCVALFAGLMPVPGGIGVTEAALTAGFIAIGIDEATAFAAAITYRVVTYYTPPVIGFGAFRWLQRQRYL